MAFPLRDDCGRDRSSAAPSRKRDCATPGYLNGFPPGKCFLAGGAKRVTMELAQMKCTPYKTGSPPLTRKEMMDLLGQVPGWSLQAGHLSRTFTFPDAATCLDFISEIAGFAAREGHFPDLWMKEGRFVEVSFYTYLAGGLTLNDFIMAAKLNDLGHARQ
jgi:4a-hydroxytetrahydrobiopterin dehydratase